MAVSDDDFAGVMTGLREVAALVEGRGEPARIHVPDAVDVRAIRKHLGLTQKAFSDRFGFAPATIRDWEQGRRRPEASARILLTVIDKEPEAVQRALGQR